MTDNTRPLFMIGDVVAPLLIAGSWFNYVTEWAAVMALLWYLTQFALAVPDLINLWIKFTTWLKKPPLKP